MGKTPQRRRIDPANPCTLCHLDKKRCVHCPHCAHWERTFSNRYAPYIQRFPATNTVAHMQMTQEARRIYCALCATEGTLYGDESRRRTFERILPAIEELMEHIGIPITNPHPLTSHASHAPRCKYICRLCGVKAQSVLCQLCFQGRTLFFIRYKKKLAGIGEQGNPLCERVLDEAMRLRAVIQAREKTTGSGVRKYVRREILPQLRRMITESALTP